ncbi:uncharacterized protein CPUR_05390 [Claviceps purpurea 20.1]|uniref:Uncharacterized protein n=1 Tax=Claviceps purpurea (strain 20.1) TaxID=1111077 RepID=M1VWM6_CLAP2|nr:uncharacterized protein CPUR_05390 [Claviceps purpurea 20.1]
MSRAIKAALGRMERYVLSPVRPGRRDKIFRGNGVFGMRAAPTPCRDNDRMIRHPSRLAMGTPDEDTGSADGTESAQTPTDANAKGAALEKLGTYDKYEIAEDDCYNELGYSFSNWKKWHILSAIFWVQVSETSAKTCLANSLLVKVGRIN